MLYFPFLLTLLTNNFPGFLDIHYPDLILFHINSTFHPDLSHYETSLLTCELLSQVQLTTLKLPTELAQPAVEESDAKSCQDYEHKKYYLEQQVLNITTKSIQQEQQSSFLSLVLIFEVTSITLHQDIYYFMLNSISTAITESNKQNSITILFILHNDDDMNQQHGLNTTNDKISLDEVLFTLEESIVYKFGLQNLPRQAFQLNSKVYFVTTDEIFELYYLKLKLVVRRLKSNTLMHNSITTRRRDFEGQQIIAGLGRNYSFDLNQETIDARSSSVKFLRSMSIFLNFTSKYATSQNWHKMRDETLFEKNDIGLTPVGMIQSIAKQTRFLNFPTYNDKVQAYFSLRKLGYGTGTEHLQPFDTKVWFLMLTFALIFALLYFYKSNDFSESLLWITSLITTRDFIQTDETKKHNNTILWISFIGTTMCYILYAMYSAELISSLSNIKEKESSLHQLVTENYTFGLVNDSYLQIVRKARDYKSNGTTGKALQNLLPGYEQIDLKNALLGILQKDHFAIITEINIYKKFFQGLSAGDLDLISALKARKQPLCKFLRDALVPEFKILLAPITRKDSAFINHFNWARIRILENGVWDQVNKRHDLASIDLKPKCVSIKAEPFGLEHVKMPLFVIQAGLVVCFLLFLSEKVYFKRQVYFNCSKKDEPRNAGYTYNNKEKRTSIAKIEGRSKSFSIVSTNSVSPIVKADWVGFTP